MKLILYTVLTLAGSLLLLKLLVLWVEPRLTFFPAVDIPATPADYGFDYEQFHFASSDGVELVGWKIPAAGAARADLLFFHGNAGNVSAGRLELLLEFSRRGYNVVTFDYRGYGASAGSPTEEGIYLDTEAFTRYYRENFSPSDLPVLYFGRSLGGVTAARASRALPPSGLVLEATFPDKTTLLRFYPLPLRLAGRLSRYRLPTAEFLQGHRFPILLIHGDRDTIVPWPAGKALYARLEEPKQLHLIPGASHGDQYLVGGETYWKTVRKFTENLTP